MNPPRLQSMEERQVDLANLNAMAAAIRRGELVGVDHTLEKRVVGGRIMLSVRPDAAQARLPFAVWQSAVAEITVEPGTAYLNSTAYAYAGAEISVGSGTDQLVIATLTVQGTIAVDVSVVSALPAYSLTTRVRVLAYVTASSGTIKSLVPKRAPGDLYIDDVLPRGSTDYRVAIMDATATGSGWSGATLPGGKGFVNDVVRATESDAP